MTRRVRGRSGGICEIPPTPCRRYRYRARRVISLNIGLGLAVHDWVRFDVSASRYVSAVGLDDEARAFGLGDILASAMISLIRLEADDNSGGIGLGFVPILTVPSGRYGLSMPKLSQSAHRSRTWFSVCGWRVSNESREINSAFSDSARPGTLWRTFMLVSHRETYHAKRDIQLGENHCVMVRTTAFTLGQSPACAAVLTGTAYAAHVFELDQDGEDALPVWRVV